MLSNLRFSPSPSAPSSKPAFLKTSKTTLPSWTGRKNVVPLGLQQDLELRFLAAMSLLVPGRMLAFLQSKEKHNELRRLRYLLKAGITQRPSADLPILLSFNGLTSLKIGFFGSNGIGHVASTFSCIISAESPLLGTCLHNFMGLLLRDPQYVLYIQAKFKKTCCTTLHYILSHFQVLENGFHGSSVLCAIGSKASDESAPKAPAVL